MKEKQQSSSLIMTVRTRLFTHINQLSGHTVDITIGYKNSIVSVNNEEAQITVQLLNGKLGPGVIKNVLLLTQGTQYPTFA